MQRTTSRNRGAERLTSVLDERGWSPRKLARVLDCDHSTVILWKEGRTIPTLHRAIDIERETGVDVHDWLVPVPSTLPPANDVSGDSARVGAPFDEPTTKE
jgi:transcriptional regulator with XRE-family HTH domain